MDKFRSISFLERIHFALGHIVIQPKSNAHDISEFQDSEWRVVAEWIPKVANAMKKVLREIMGKEVVKIYLCSFNESSEYPVHFHLVPRYECETLRGPDLLFYRSKARQMLSPSDRDAIARGMRRELNIEKKE